MSALTQQQKTKLLLLHKQNPNLAFIQAVEMLKGDLMSELTRSIENVEARIPEKVLFKHIESLRGEDGDDGKDSDPETVAQLLLANPAFIKKTKGEDGKSVHALELASYLKSDKEFLQLTKGKDAEQLSVSDIVASLIKNDLFINGVKSFVPNTADIADALKNDKTFVQSLKGKDGSSDTAKEIAKKLNTLNEEVDTSVLKGFSKIISDMYKAINLSRKNSGGGGGGGMSNVMNQSFSVSSATTSITLNSRVGSNGRAIWLNYQGQQQAYNTHFTVSGQQVSLLFTPDDNTFIDVIYIRA